MSCSQRTGTLPEAVCLSNADLLLSPSSISGDQESCRHSVDSQGSGGVPRKQMRLDHFAAAAQQLDCGFDRHHYPPDSFGSASSSKTEQVKDARAHKASFKWRFLDFLVLKQS